MLLPGDFGTLIELSLKCYFKWNYVHSSDYFNRKSLKITSYAFCIIIRVRSPAGNQIGGSAYFHFQNIKTTYYYQTKFRILIVYEKRENLGWSFLVGGVPKLRRSKIKLQTLIITSFILSTRHLGTPPTRKLHPRFSLFSYRIIILSLVW